MTKKSRITFIGAFNKHTVEDALQKASEETGKEFEMNIHTTGHYVIQAWWDNYNEMENVTITLKKVREGKTSRDRDLIRKKNEDKIKRAIELIK